MCKTLDISFKYQIETKGFTKNRSIFFPNFRRVFIRYKVTFGLLGVVAPDVLAFAGAALAFAIFNRFGGVFFAAGVSTGGLTFLGTDCGDAGWLGNLPPFFRDNNSGWILGNTPPDAIVTPFSN